MFFNTHQKFCIALVTGTPGSGKSFCCSRDVFNVLVQGDRCVVTNLPINVDVMAEWVCKERPDLSESDVIDRITILEPELLQRWKRGEGGPWEIKHLAEGIKGRDGKPMGADLILDECHLYCPSTGDGISEDIRGRRKDWKDWLGEVRHEGWRRIVFVSQDDEKIGKPIQIHAELRYELTNGATERMPWFRIPFGDWYGLIASFTRIYIPVIIITEYRRAGGRPVFVHAERVRLFPKYFALYESYAHAGGGSVAGAIERPKMEWEIRPVWWWATVDGVRKAPTWAWFYLKYKFRITGVFIFAGVVGWACFFGGLSVIVNHLVATVNRATQKAFVLNPIGKKPSKAEKTPAAGEAPPEATSSASLPPEDAGEFAKALVATMATLTPEQREPIERAMREAAVRIRMQGVKVTQLEADAERLKAAAAEAAAAEIASLPKVTGFVGNDKAFIDGRTMKVGDVILFNEGKSRVRIRRIDRAERVVYLEDARVIRFPVRDADIRLPQFAAPGLPTSSANAASQPPAPLQSVGRQTAGSEPGGAASREKSILVPRSDAAPGVRPPGE